MKKIMVMGAVIAITSSAHSALTDPIDPIDPVVKCWSNCVDKTVVVDTATCTNELCRSCKTGTTSNIYGVDVRQIQNVKLDCNTGKCSCDKSSTEYECSAGYYGTARSASAGCTKCPENATCAGGNGSTFLCDKGYYKNGAICTRCPSSGGVYGTTALAGATDITSCFLPTGTAFSDETGSGTYTSHCLYVK